MQKFFKFKTEEEYETEKSTLPAGYIAWVLETDSVYYGSDVGVAVSPFKEITYDELKALRDGAKLSVGTMYRITDYETTTCQMSSSVDETNFDVIVLAIAADKLSEDARAIEKSGSTYFSSHGSHPEAWKLRYCIDNDTDRFAWALGETWVEIAIDAPLDRDFAYQKRCPDFDRGDREYQYAFGDYQTLNDGDNTMFFYAKTEHLSVGDYVERDGVDYQVSRVFNGKGVIYEMEDEYGNKCPYDFKTIKFRRFICNSVRTSKSEGSQNKAIEERLSLFKGEYVILHLGATQSSGDNDMKNFGDDAKDMYTFSYVDEDGQVFDASVYSQAMKNDENYATGVHDNIIKNCFERVGYEVYAQEEEGFPARLHLNNIVLGAIWNDENLFYGICGNSFGVNCYNNTFGNYVRDNTFGNDVRYNTFGNYVWYNTFGNDVRDNTFGNYVGSNTFGNYVESNTFGNDVWYNTFGNYVESNTFGNYVESNTFGNYVEINTFGNDVRYNTFGNDVRNNTFGNDVRNNTFGNYVHNCFFGVEYYNSKNNYVGIKLENCRFGDGCWFLTFGETNKTAASDNSVIAEYKYIQILNGGGHFTSRATIDTITYTATSATSANGLLGGKTAIGGWSESAKSFKWITNVIDALLSI